MIFIIEGNAQLYSTIYVSSNLITKYTIWWQLLNLGENAIFIESIVNCDLTPLHQITVSFCCQLSVLPCIEIALLWEGVEKNMEFRKTSKNVFLLVITCSGREYFLYCVL